MPDETVIKKIVREVVKEELKPFDLKFVSFKNEIIAAVRETNEKLFERVEKIRDETITSNDKVAGEIKTMREEQEMLNGRTAKINDVDNRVDRLEQIHPNCQHAISA